MKNNLYLLSIFLVLIISCQKRSEDFTVIETASNFDYHAIELLDGQLYATGGDVWNKSILAQSSDGTNWQIDSFANKSIFDLHVTNDTVYAVGGSGYIFRGGNDFNFRLSRIRKWGIIKGFTQSATGFIAAGGKNINQGYIYKITNKIKVDTFHNFDYAFADVKCGLQSCIAVGFGIIQYSIDDGLTWIQSEENGDNFKSISYNSQGLPFVVGNEGSIKFSEDNGQSWKTINGGHSPLGSNPSFLKIKFSGKEGVIVGENGLIWHSEDDGLSWNSISLETDLDLFDVVFDQNHLMIASENGKIISTSL